jgi:enoyl-CoA hydratase/carnithine racemase
MNATIDDSSRVGAEPEVSTRSDDNGPIVRLTLNRANKYNVLSASMIAALLIKLRQISAHSAARVVVLESEGRAFCAGHDLTEMGPDVDEEQLRSLFAACTELMLTIRRIPQAVIARVHGVATAAGCQLVAMCDLAIASSDARFAVSGINLGLFCSTPAVALSRNLLPKPALEMLLTGEFIDAQTALRLGLVNRVVSPELLDTEVERLGMSIASKSPRAIAAGKRLFYEQRDLPIDAAYALAVDVMARNAVTPEAREGIARFVRRQ